MTCMHACTQVEDRKFLLEEHAQEQQAEMAAMLKELGSKEHEYMAHVAALGAHQRPQVPVRKDPEKVHFIV